MMDHRETAADSVYHMILCNLMCFALVPVFIFGRAVRKVAGINYQNPIMVSCYECEILVSFTNKRNFVVCDISLHGQFTKRPDSLRP